MKKRLELRIDTPCAANWRDMPSAAQGRFCLSCRKQVTDFSTLEEHDIKRFFKNYKGTVCGRFQQHQLKHYTYNAPVKSPLLTLLALTGLSFLMPAAAQVHSGTSFTQSSPARATDKAAAEKTDAAEGYIISGRIFYKDGEAELPLPGANVLIEGTPWGAITDTTGSFEIKLPELPQEASVAKILYIGYMPMERNVVFGASHTLDLGLLYMQEDQALMGEVVIIDDNPMNRLWWKIKNLFR